MQAELQDEPAGPDREPDPDQRTAPDLESRTRTRDQRRTRPAAPDPPGLLHLDRQPDPARARPEPAQPCRTTKPRPRKIQHIRAQARIKTAREAVGTPWAPLAACGSVSAGFF